MRFSVILIAVLTISLSGCVNFSNLPTDSELPTASNETVLILGVQPRYRTGIWKGVGDGKTWKRDMNSHRGSNIVPENGYIVTKLKSLDKDESYGLTSILPDGIGYGAPIYSPCNEQTVFTFQALPGKVVYVGDIAFKQNGRRMEITYSFQPDQARRFITEHYSGLAANLEMQEAKSQTMTNFDCNPKAATPILIMLPRVR